MAYSIERNHCKKYLPLLRLISLEPELREWCRINGEGHDGLIRVAYSELVHDAYQHKMVIKSIIQFLKKSGKIITGDCSLMIVI